MLLILKCFVYRRKVAESFLIILAMIYSCFSDTILVKYIIWYCSLTLKENKEEGDDVGEFWLEIPAWLLFVRHLKLDLHLPLTLRQLHSNACVEQSPSHSKEILKLALHDYFLPYQRIHHSNWKISNKIFDLWKWIDWILFIYVSL